MADQKVTLVFFLGGVTYAEVAALRFLAQQDDGRHTILLSCFFLHDIQLCIKLFEYTDCSMTYY